MRDVISIYHPEFRKSKSLRAYGMKFPDIFTVERLIEESLAAVGSYKFTDGDHADFSDGTDSKTSSIGINPTVPGGNSHAGVITGVETVGGVRKAGALRCTVYNPHKDSLKFYFLPKSMWSKHITINTASRRGGVHYCYHKPCDHIFKFDGYECSSFEELALAK